MTVALCATWTSSIGKLHRRILAFLYEQVTGLDDPRTIGGALKGSELGKFWKYRVGDYRVISSIEHEVLRVLVVRIDHRREVYR